MLEVFLATDHAGFELKESVKKFLQKMDGVTVTDCGAHTFDPKDDYPELIAKAGLAVSEAKDKDNTRAIIFGGSGQGEAIVANKFPGVRAVVFYGSRLPLGAADANGRTSEDPLEMIRLTREHNNANVLSVGARFVSQEDAFQAVTIFLRTPFDPASRHAKRIEKITDIENSKP